MHASDGNELDQRIGKQVFGIPGIRCLHRTWSQEGGKDDQGEVSRTWGVCGSCRYRWEGEKVAEPCLPAYSTEHEAMELVVERMEEEHRQHLSCRWAGEVDGYEATCRAGGELKGTAVAPTPEQAMCFAALAALEEREEGMANG